MATVRAHIFLEQSADDAWELIGRPTRIKEWFPNVLDCTIKGDIRIVSVAGGVIVEERVVSNDATLRRFQYSLVGGPVPVQTHLSTVDVIENGTGSIVVYSTDVTPDEMAPDMQKLNEAAVAALKSKLDQA